MKRDWWAPLTGVAFVVLAIVSFTLAGEPPDPEDPIAEIVEFYTDNKDSVMFGAALAAVAGTLLVFFAATLRTALQAGRGADSSLPTVALIGAAIFAIGVALDGTISFALAETVDDVDPTATQALHALWNNDFLPFSMGLQILMLAAGLSIVRYGGLPTWLGWVAIVLGVAAVTPVGFFAFLLAGVWILIVSVMLTLRLRAGAGPAAPPPPATVA